MNGSTSSIAISSNESIDDLYLSDFTIDFYIKARSGETSYTESPIFTKDNGGWTDGWAIFLTQYANTCDMWAFMGRSENESKVYDTVGFSDDEWVHVTFVWKASESTWYVGINGVWGAQNPSTGSGDFGTDAGVNLRIGNDAFPNGLDSPAPFADLSWIRISSGARYTPGVDFTPPVNITPPTVDANTIELWKLNGNANAVVNAINNGVVTDCTWAEHV